MILNTGTIPKTEFQSSANAISYKVEAHLTLANLTGTKFQSSANAISYKADGHPNP